MKSEPTRSGSRRFSTRGRSCPTSGADPELLDQFWRGHLFHVEQGADSFINDCRFVASDWESLLRPATVPVHFVHGTRNRSIRPERVLAFAERLNARVSLVENAGHSLPFSHWRDWARFL